MTDARPTAVQRATRMLIRQPIWGFVVLIFVFFSLVSDHFLSLGNFSNILVQTSTIGLIALGMTLVMINGNIDLSVGATLALAANIAIDMLGWPMFAGLGDWVILPAVAVALATGVLLGALNGVIVWKTGVNAFIVTLGAMLGVRGLVFIYTDEQSFFSMNFTYSDIGSSSILGLPTLAVIFIVFALLTHILLSRTTHGRDTYAVGDNPDAAVNAGIRVGPHMVINFMIVGFFAALAGITLSMQLGAATPNLGREYELWVITAVVLGGTKLTGGVGSIVGTIGGVLAIGILRNGMNLMQVSSFYVLVILGTILIAVLILDKHFNRRGSEALKI
jgi:ribose transport system permease protein